LENQIEEILIKRVAPMLWPTHFNAIADELEKDIPNFNRDKFLTRAIKAWEDAQPEIDFNDEIPY